tara:strand:- start:293 stop:451 length:159 start_codon:yes stop_codon:yes gene_type:complete
MKQISITESLFYFSLSEYGSIENFPKEVAKILNLVHFMEFPIPIIYEYEAIE